MKLFFTSTIPRHRDNLSLKETWNGYITLFVDFGRMVKISFREWVVNSVVYLAIRAFFCVAFFAFANKFNLLIRHLLKVLVKVLLIQMFSAGKSVYEYIGFLFGCEAKLVFTFKRSNHRVSFIREDLFEVFPELISVMGTVKV